MTEIAKQKASNFLVGLYRGTITIGILTLVFNGGVWKNEIEHDISEKGFKDSKEKYEVFQAVKDNTTHSNNRDLHMPKEEKDLLYVQQADFDKAIEALITSIARIEKKIDNKKYIN